MPIYEYLCPDEHRFEVVQRFSDEPVTVCEVCSKPVQRVLFAPAVHYKGKGFYATDYGRKGANGVKPDSTGGSESGSKEGAAASSGNGSDSGSGSGSESKSSDSKGSDSKGSSSKSSGGESSSSRKSESSKPAA
jgi:putative FmdB family regulatory protein